MVTTYTKTRDTLSETGLRGSAGRTLHQNRGLVSSDFHQSHWSCIFQCNFSLGWTLENFYTHKKNSLSLTFNNNTQSYPRFLFSLSNVFFAVSLSFWKLKKSFCNAVLCVLFNPLRSFKNDEEHEWEQHLYLNTILLYTSSKYGSKKCWRGRVRKGGFRSRDQRPYCCQWTLSLY